MIVPASSRRSQNLLLGPRFAVALLALLVGAFGGFAGCGLATSGIPSPEQEGGVACTTSAECNDENPCTTDTCAGNGSCTHVSVADGPAPAASQPQGNCKQIQCTSGVAKTVDDNANTPMASDTCSTGTCDMGTPQMKDEPDGMECTSNGAPGVCKAGVCKVSCKTAKDCISNNTCKTGTCDGATGMCSYIDMSDGTPTPGFTQIAGDCKIQICLGGVSTAATDDSDVPTVPTANLGCETGICDNGTPTFPKNPTNSMCSTYKGSMPGVCDSDGTCSQCTEDTECSGTTNDCQKPVCDMTTFTCTQQYTAKGTKTTTNPMQIEGDCMVIECDGKGGTTSVVDQTDVPLPTNEGCTLGTCSASGMPGTAPQMDGVACGTTNMCSGTTAALSCKSGLCKGCTMDCECQPPTNGFCSNPNCGCNPFTCQLGSSHPSSPAVTCGVNIADGCGSVLNCNDGVQDGNETDIDCGGPTSGGNAICATRCSQGQKCNVTSDCTNGLSCADGVCCNTPCGGACQACTVALTGQSGGVDGTCQAVVAGGTAAHSGCTSSPAASCGNDMNTCDGSGNCADWPSGTQCAAAFCTGTVLTSPQDCNGTGTCVGPPQTHDCAPYLCGGSPAACGTTCSTDAQCSTGNYCSGSSCVMKLTTGTACTAPDECQSNFCVSGFCCNVACGGKCQACSGAATGGTNGTCASVTAGSADPSGICTGMKTMMNTCSFDGLCGNGGACQKWPAGTGCSAVLSCAAGGSTEIVADQCDGNGSCKNNPQPNPCPGGEACNAAGTACGSSCTPNSTTGCASGDYCTAGATCTPQGGPGATCSGNYECTTNDCLGSSCCTSGGCVTGGTCGASSCGGGGGACVYPGGSTSCGTPMCSGSTLTPMACNGSGSCAAGTPGACPGNLLCATSSTCKSSCATAADCVAGYACKSGMCEMSAPAGASCNNSSECSSGACLGGFCCPSGCVSGAPCGVTSCNAAGACVYPTGSTCGTPSCSGSTLTPMVCSGTGSCVAGSGGACPGNLMCATSSTCTGSCATAADCVTGYACQGGNCVMNAAAGASCNAAGECASGVCMTNCCTASCPTGMGACQATSCDTSGGCVGPDSTTSCGAPPSCTGAMQTNAGSCNGTGSCSQTTTACGAPYVCIPAGTTCATNCPSNDMAGDTYCANQYWCNGTACTAAQGQHAACTRNSQCANGNCAGGMCP